MALTLSMIQKVIFNGVELTAGISRVSIDAPAAGPVTLTLDILPDSLYIDPETKAVIASTRSWDKQGKLK